jgi:regulation of enolase protein 1 (concanavalin A-like superfamily)
MLFRCPPFSFGHSTSPVTAAVTDKKIRGGAVAKWWRSVAGVCVVAACAASAEATTFADQDIGTVAAAGSVTVSSGTYTVNASGADIWGNADAFHFMYQAWTGDGIFVTRVTGMTNTNPWAKAGLMIRQDLTPGSPYMFLCTNPAHADATFFRLRPGGPSTYYNYQSALLYSPVWLKLVRAGDVMTSYFSADGLVWQLFGISTVAMPATVYVGVAVTSHADGTLCTTTFDHLNLADAPPSGLTAAARSSSEIDLAWSDNSARETGFEIERSTDNINFSLVSTTSTNAINFADSGAAPLTTYYYRVRYASANGPSTYTNMASATTTAVAPAGWTSSDIDVPSVPGQITSSGGIFTVQGSGTGVGGINFVHPQDDATRDLGYTVIGAIDQFQLASKPWSKDGELIARVTSLSGPAGSEAGIMLRSDLTVSALNVFLAVRPGGGLTFMTRSGIYSFPDSRFVNTTSTITSSASGYPLPLWLRLVRSSGTFTAYESADGTSWTQVGSVAFTMPTNIIAGLAVSSTKDGSYAFGTFDNVVINYGQAPAIPAAPTGLIATIPFPSSVALNWTYNPSSNINGFEIQRSVDNITFTTIATIGNYLVYEDRGLSPSTTYYYRVRAFLESSESAFTNTASINLQFASDLSGTLDIGTVGAAGSASLDGGVYTLNGSGADIWGTADAFYFNYEEWDGDGTFTARLTGLTNTNGWAKAGIMIRENNSAGARYVAIFGSPTGNAAQQFRAQTDGSSNFTISVYEASPMWLRLVRSGNVFQTFQSADGITWTAVWTSVTLNLGPLVDIGFAVTSHNDGTIATATFDHVSFASSAPPPPSQVAAPTFSPAAGTYTSAQTVTIASATSGASIRYTVNGNAPTSTTGTIYSGPVNISSTATLNAIAYESGFADSTVTSGIYTISSPPPQVATPIFSPGGGYYGSTQVVTITSATSGATIRYTTDGSTPSETVGTLYSGPVSIGPTLNPLVLKAIAYESGFVDSTVIADDYAIGAPPPPPSTWADSDIGNVGVAGGFTSNGGNLNVRGSGADIWDSADAFHFAYQPLHGDGTIVAQVTSLDNTNGFAKAGVMVRQSLASDSPNAFAFLTPGQGAAFQTRAASGGSTTFNAGPWWVSPPYWVKLVRSGNTFSAYTSPEGTTWTLVATQAVAMTADVYVGLAVTSHANSVSATGVFTNVTVTGSGAPPPPPPTWADSDIGNVGVAGGFALSGGTLSVHGSGADIWGSVDAFHFTYQPWHGDGEILAQVASLDNTNAFAKAGVMFRQSLAADSPNAFVFLTPGEGAAFQTRAAGGGATTFNAGPWWVSAPYWVKLVRSGNTFSSYASPNGTTWTLVTTQTVAMSADVYVGFAVTSHNNLVSATANFTDFMVDVP